MYGCFGSDRILNAISFFIKMLMWYRTEISIRENIRHSLNTFDQAKFCLLSDFMVSLTANGMVIVISVVDVLFHSP